MSYSFNGSNTRLSGSFTSAYGYPITIAGWYKIADHPQAIRVFTQLGNNSGNFLDSVGIRTSGTDGTWAASSIGSGGGTQVANINRTIDGIWYPFITTFTGDSARAIYVSDGNGTGAGTQTVAQALQFISVGASLATSQFASGLIAEVAIWNKELNSTERGNYFSGNAASTIGSANLIGYWPLSSSNSTQTNLGNDAGGNLTVTNATFDADHPTIGGTAPSFDTLPAVQSQTSTAYTISFNADANANTLYVGSYPKDATAPTASQLKAGTGAHGTASKSTGGSDDTIVLTPSDNPKFPIYDLYAVLEGTAGFSSVASMVDEFLDPTSGFQFITVDVPWGGEEESILQDASPAIVDGDIIRCSTNTSPGNYAVTMDPDGVFSFNPGVDTSRQSIDAHVYDISVQGYSNASPISFWVNNILPEFVGTGDPYLFEKDIEIDEIDLNSQFGDEEGDTLTFTAQTALPAGLSLNAGIISGTPTTYGQVDTTIRAADITGDYIEQDLTFLIGDRIPDVVNMLEEDAIEAIEAIAGFTVLIPSITANSNIVANGKVISSEPPADALSPPDQEVQLTVSIGPTETINYGYPLVS